MSKQLTGGIMVLVGAMSYGILATIVKYANNLGIHTAVLTFLQVFLGWAILLILSQFEKKQTAVKPNKLKLLVFGTTFGMTSIFYYLSIQYITVSLGIILLMQSIWMSLLVEIFIHKQKPDIFKIVGTIVIMIGTILATNVLVDMHSIKWQGIALGLLAALSYTFSLYASNRIETQINPLIRSKYFILGALLFVSLYWNVTIIKEFTNANSLFWGLLLALFGTVIPPLLFTRGFPLVGIGIGAIIASIEIPVSIFSAHLVLGERINGLQWLGVTLTIVSILLVNYQSIRRKP